MSRIKAGELQEFCMSVAMQYGAPEQVAAALIESLIDADLKGIDTHGVARLAIYLERVKEGLIDPRAAMEFHRSFSAAGILDAHNGFGQIAGVRGMHRAIALARTHGMGAVGIRNSQHFGAAGYYCDRAAGEEFIGLALTNSEPAMPPWGGYEPFLGTNPVALGVPTRNGYPILIDLSTSVVARGRIIAASQKGDAIPEGWAVDRKGHPTTEPEEALEGAVLPMAGAKGYALALLVDILSGLLSGAEFGGQVGSMYKDFTRTANVGHFIMAFNIEAFMEKEQFFRRIDTLRRTINAVHTRPDVHELRLPGERKYRTREERLRKGIPLGDEVIQQLKALADEVGVSWIGGENCHNWYAGTSPAQLKGHSAR